MRCSVYIICPTVLSCSNLKLQQTLEVKNNFKQEKILLQLTFIPELTLTGFRTTQPWTINCEVLILNLVCHFLAVSPPWSRMLKLREEHCRIIKQTKTVEHANFIYAVIYSVSSKHEFIAKALAFSHIAMDSSSTV